MASSILFFSLLFVLPFVDSHYFKYPSFTSSNPDIAFQGDAHVVEPDGIIDFNRVDLQYRVGWATYARKVSIWDTKSGKASDISTNFSFSIDIGNKSNYGDGLVFFLAPVGVQIPPNSAGATLGLFNQTSFPLQLVHIEFDTFYNPGWDPKFTHVGINHNSLKSSNYTSWNAISHSGDTCHAQIKYDSATKNLSVSWTYDGPSDPREVTSLSYIIDLAKVLPPQVTIGFSGSTGLYTEWHKLLSWEFSSSLSLGGLNKRRMIIGVSVSGFLLLTLVVVVFIVIWRQKQRKEKARETTNSRPSINEDLERGAGPRKFSYKEVALATNNFLGGRKLGEGGFGAVYRGYLSDLDMMVAVKKFIGGSKQGKREFITEVKVISSLRHRNLVQLIGWCHEKDEFLLIYEFMPNGSLDSHLFGRRTHLSWATRYKISLGLSSALFYLHEEWEQCVVHRDIKASNIMLDSNFNAKLGDFGLARLMDHELGPQTTGLAGTFGYMAPEYISTGRASRESDVYSFGIVLLELATGWKSVDPRQGRIEPKQSLVEKVWDLYGKRDIVSAIDENLGRDFDTKQAECIMVVGLWSAHPDRNSRPSTRQVIQVLNFETDLPNLPSKMPIATYHVASSSASISSVGGSVTFSSATVGR